MRRRYERRPNHARLFRNKDKCESWQSDFRGKIFLEDGREYWIGTARRVTCTGEEYWTIYLRPDSPTRRARSNATQTRSLIMVSNTQPL
jgi:hypothetical protein